MYIFLQKSIYKFKIYVYTLHVSIVYISVKRIDQWVEKLLRGDYFGKARIYKKS